MVTNPGKPGRLVTLFKGRANMKCTSSLRLVGVATLNETWIYYFKIKLLVKEDTGLKIIKITVLRGWIKNYYCYYTFGEE